MQFRPGSPDLDTTDVLIDAFQHFAHKVAPQGGLTNWFNAMRTKLLNGKDHLSAAQSSRANAASFLSEALREAKVWSKVFTFIPADKLKHNMVAVCSAQFAASLKTELSSNTYAPTSLSPNGITSLATDLVNFWNVAYDRLDTPCLSYLYGTAKLHKTPFRLRFIFGVSKKLSCDKFSTQATSRSSSLPPASPSFISPLRKTRNAFNPVAKLLESALKGLYLTLSTINHFEVLKGNPAFWFSTLDIDEIIVGVNSKPESWAGSVFDTGDFATMYTRLPHDKLKEAIIGLYDHASEWFRQQYSQAVYLDLRAGSWKADNPPSNNGRAALIELLNAVIDNTYVYTVDGIYRQVFGIPMGGCASSLLASLYCSWRELLYVSAHRCSLNMFRYIDDLIHARKPLEPSILLCIDYGIEFGSVEINLLPSLVSPSVIVRHLQLVRTIGGWLSTAISSDCLMPLLRWQLTLLLRSCVVLSVVPGPSLPLVRLSRNRLV